MTHDHQPNHQQPGSEYPSAEYPSNEYAGEEYLDSIGRLERLDRLVRLQHLERLERLDDDHVIGEAMHRQLDRYPAPPTDHMVPNRLGIAAVGASDRHRRVLSGVAVAAAVLFAGSGLVAASRAGSVAPPPGQLPIPTIPTTPTTPTTPGGAPSTTAVFPDDATNPVDAGQIDVGGQGGGVDGDGIATSPDAPTATPPANDDTGNDDLTEEDSTEEDSTGEDSTEDDSTGDDAEGTSEPLLFWGKSHVGRWTGSGFDYSGFEDPGPEGLLGSTVVLHNQAGATHVGAVVQCNGAVAVSPSPPFLTGVDNYWFTDGAPLTLSQVDDGGSLEAMNAALLQLGLDPARAGSYGAPLAADGSADRLMWYKGDGEYIWWIATFDVESGTFGTVDGAPDVDPGFEIGVPPGVWTDLDNDGNLESIAFGGDAPSLREWATGDSAWSANLSQCEG